MHNLARYQRIAPFYDFLDLPFEYRRYRKIRPLLFEGMNGRLLDAGVGTGRNFDFYPPTAHVIGVDLSPAMLDRAKRRRGGASRPIELRQGDVTALDVPDDFFDGAVATFLFCVLPDELQVQGLNNLARVVKPGGTIRLLEYTRPASGLRRAMTRIWQPWIHWAYGASFDRNTEQYLPSAGLHLVEARFVLDDLIKLITAAPMRPTSQ
jgi:ubiquinone/menaquinone biosynthesis C-methylase UbiE